MEEDELRFLDLIKIKLYFYVDNLFFFLLHFNKVIRLLFAAACQDYQDARIDPCDWPIVKPNTPFEQLPILLVQKDCCNGLVIAQTNAIGGSYSPLV